MPWTTLKEEAEINLPHLTLTGKVEYDPGQQALTITDPTTGEEEVLSVNPTEYGYIAFPGEVFVKDWSEHQGLPAALEQAGIATVKAPITVGPFASTAYRMRLNGQEEAQ